MNKYTLCFIAAVSFITGIASVNAQTNRVCGTNEAWKQATQIDPTLVIRREQMNTMIEQYLQSHKNARTSGVDSDAVRIIPTVFHVIYEYNGIGLNDNILDSWVNDAVQGCIAITNADYRRQNADTVNTPLAFRPVAADTKIEFRLATIDPNGNCTDGITRTFSHRTSGFNDFGKSVIDWPSDKYLNIWVVQTINFGSAGIPGGEIIGYAQFPVSGPSQTDGVVLKYDFVGGFGESTYSGRDGDHEIGHYLNMIHIWGDADCGDDHCADTPVQFGPTYGDPCFPPTDTCFLGDACGAPNPPGIMFENYMDYTNGDSKNIWTQDQKARMRATLDVARFSLWQPSNLAATGTSDPYVYPAHCPPQADFIPLHKSICPGSIVKFQSNTTNGKPTSWNWQFPGGSPSSSNVQNPPNITYNNQGAYHVILTVTNAQGTTTIDRGDAVIVDWGFGITHVPFFEGFEGSQALPQEWRVFNDDGGPAWQRTNRASYSGSYSMSVQNHETINNTAPGSYKELLSPSVDFSRVTSPVLTFQLSYGQQYTANTDSLSVGISIDCGASWTELKHLAGSNLAVGSGGFQPNDFAPTNQNQWQLVSIPLNSYAAKPKVKFRFQFITGTLSNNIYIDDVNITGVVGINEELNPAFEFNAEPNPASQSFTVSYLLKNPEDVTVNLYDLQGRFIRQIESGHQSPGAHQTMVDGNSFNLASGVYILKMFTPDGVVSKKLVYTNE